MQHNWKSAQVVNSHLVCDPATGFRPPSATVVSAEPFSHGTGTLRCLQKEMATYRHWSVFCVLVARHRDCSTLSNPVPWQNWMAAYLSYSLQMKTLFRCWPVMVHDTHRRRRRRMDNWTHGAASRHTITPISHTRLSAHSHSYYSFPVLGRRLSWPQYASQLSLSSAQQYYSLGVFKMLTPHGWTHGQTFDWFYKSSWETWLKTMT